MKNIILAIAIFSFTMVSAQVYKGKGDQKMHVGAGIQNHATSINLAYYYGFGENFSAGIASNYALGLSSGFDPKFGDRIDVKAMLNANIGSILNIDDNFDLYPGLNIGIKNFGAHLGARYFFSDGLGVYVEFIAPISKYKTGTLTDANKLHNQISGNIGVAFNF